MKLKIDKGLVPIKAHFFFFFAALGPILPQINVFGRQLGVSPGVMGMVTAVLPLLWAAAKPLFGYIVDFWPTHRKLVFMVLISIMSGSYCCLWFLPMPDPREATDPKLVESIHRLNDTVYLKQYNNNSSLEKYKCHWNCSMNGYLDVYLSNSPYINTVYIDNEVSNTSCSTLSMDFKEMASGFVICAPKENCDLICLEIEFENVAETNLNVTNSTDILLDITKNSTRISLEITTDSNDRFYMTATFWAFVILMCVGTVAFNVANCIGDAVCFDVLGPERGSKYGAQRAWGTAGYGITALLGGWLIDRVSPLDGYKDFTPAFVVVLVATAVDLFSCRALTLPSLSSPDDSGKALRDVLKIPKVMVFITFAIVAGTFDSFIIYYMFWFLEELAEETGHTAQIKLIEGVVVAAESLLGELLFFYFSGKILRRWGYGATLTVSLACYGIRMALISLIQNPWHLVFIEGVMQGPTYALCYATIVGYAAHVAPEGYSATVQGIVAGMDDGVGFAIGSLLGGQLYGWIGGRGSFQVFAVVAICGSVLHAILFYFVSRSDSRAEQRKSAESLPEEGEKMLSEHSNAIYRETVIPLTNGNEQKVDR